MASARQPSPDDATANGAAELDELTLRRAQRGDPAACRQLVERYQRAVFALISRVLGPRRDAALVEDLAQETFLRVFRAIGGFSALGKARLSTWILTIATRLAIDELRKQPPPAPLDEAVDRVPAAGRADDRARRKRIGDAIGRAVEGLAPEYRAAFVLRAYHDLSYADIARALEVDVGTVKSRLSRAKAALREALAEVHDD